MNRKKQNRKHWWLFAIPALMVPLALGLRASTQPHPYVDADLGTFASYQAGKKVALSKLSQELKAHPEAVNFSMRWAIGKTQGEPSNSFVGIGYSRRDRKFTSVDLKSNTEPTLVSNVDEQDIHHAATVGGVVTSASR